jgi:hypothetical protein
MGTRVLRWPTQTEVDSCGVKPEKKALVLSWALPVLPATGRPGSAAARPVPPVTTPRSIATVWAEILELITCLQSRLCSISGLRWSGATTLTIEYGAQRTPLLASTPKALAMSSTETSLTPSTSEQTAHLG